ncbi:CLUMA_CG015961, isoform A [Clunio marinus]|uniref:CLUMA_CG015961, isoform A n=1 Tax=Clunio marinus TaxID=568069 RepID=A0A1J1IR50_9DIPT|nr:CLUMA_CG015961, isoform A [Clunio marinus]
MTNLQEAINLTDDLSREIFISLREKICVFNSTPTQCILSMFYFFELLDANGFAFNNVAGDACWLVQKLKQQHEHLCIENSLEVNKRDKNE